MTSLEHDEDSVAGLVPPVADTRQRVDLVDQTQAGAHSTLGVVFMQCRHADDGNHGVADVLLEGAA